MSERQPPQEVSIEWCPVCGRDDRFTPFTGKSHFHPGGRCPGQPLKVTYARPSVSLTRRRLTVPLDTTEGTA